MTLVASACLADALSDGRALYKSGQYAQAAAKLEQATRDKPNDAHAWWQLNFAYNKLGRYGDALKAAQQADRVDPKHGFASEPGKYQEVVSRLQSKAGVVANPSAPRASGRANAVSGRIAGAAPRGDSLVQALTSGDVYVEPGISVDSDALARTAAELRPAVVKFVVFNNRSRSDMLARDADRVRRYLNLNNGYVIVAGHAGVSAAGPGLGRDTLRQLTGQVAPMMESGRYTEGLEQLAHSLVQKREQKAQATSNMWLGLVVVIGGVIVLIIIVRSIGRSRALASRRGPIEQEKSEVIRQLNTLDDGIGMVDARSAAAIKQARLDAGGKLDEAARILAHARSEQDLNRAQHLLDQAQADIARGRSVLDQALGGSGAPASAPAAASGGAATQAAPAAGATTAASTDWNGVPENERGVCFFCSRPSLLSELTPVTVNLDGKQQKVLACRDDVATIQTGQMPQIRAFNVGGRYVPWYASQDYDPYRDYYSRGYGARDFMSDMVMYSMIDNMFWNWHHPVGWAWGGGYGNTYVFYPEHDGYRDYYGGQAAGYTDFDRPADAGGTDFLQGSGGDYDAGAGAGTDLGRDQS